MHTESGWASAWKRAATFTVSPRTVTPASLPLCTLPTTAGPVLTPMRNCGRTPCSASKTLPSVFSRCKIESAARHARNGASSKAIGAPKIAMMPSPVKPCTTPPCSRTASSISFERLRISVKAASSPDFSEKVVKPTISVNRTVTCRRAASTKPSESPENQGSTRQQGQSKNSSPRACLRLALNVIHGAAKVWSLSDQQRTNCAVWFNWLRSV
jgi:hypothetical protein